jgi:peptide subunit release factor 1 (eRF1)
VHPDEQEVQGLPDITEDTIRDLATFKGKEPVTTCFLDVDGRRLLRQHQIEQELDSVLRPARVEANGHRPAVTHDLDRIERFVRGGFDRSNTRGIAFFACRDPELWQVVPLPVPVRSRVVVNDQPAVGELQALVEQSGRLGVLLVDRQRARMFVFSHGELVEQEEAIDPLPREVDTRHRSERSDHAGHLDAVVEQHLRRATDLAWEAYQRVGFDRLAVSAPDDLRPRLRELAHPYLRDRYCGRIEAVPTATDEQVRQAARTVEERVERAREHAVVERFIMALGTGRATEGLAPTLDALHDRRVATLLVSKGFSAPGWRCDLSGRLAARGRTCAECGGEMTELPDVVEEAIEQAFASSAQVMVIAEDADLDVHGRIGAVLRY